MNATRLRRKLEDRSDLWRKVGSRVRGQLYLDRGSDHCDTVFVAGSGRSGTTWLSEVINYDNSYRYIFEPFHPNRLRITGEFKPRQYLRPDDRDPTFLHPTESILAGRIRSVWTDKYNRAALPRRRLVKEVRANLLLPWMRANFAGMPIILVLRHPCAVVSSQLKLEWNWHTDMATLLGQRSLMEDHLDPFRAAMEEADSDVERHALVWCAENYVALRTVAGEGVHTTFYEHLVMDPATHLRSMFAFLGKPFDSRVLSRVRDPSPVTRKDSAVLSGGDPVPAWREELSAEQVRRTLEIVALFGLDSVYSDDPMPRAAGAESLGRR